MKIFLNSKETETQAADVAALAAELALPKAGVAVAVNSQMVMRDNWAATPLNEGDDVLIIKAACGG
jgi:sulfur carrier protein